MKTIAFTLNGRPQRITVDEHRQLLWVLRTDLGLTGTKYGCGEGFCGACTVVVDGRAVRACSTPMRAVDGRHVTTVEGLQNEGLHPVQQAFIDHEAFQCGFCTPGMLMAAYALIGESPTPSQERIVSHLDRNLCRCGAHTRILAAVQSAVATHRGGRS
ncbi:MAG TPA: (2Fe-2S)-binding protein [Vicinamibacterales bacterium]|nr:(2Fe-2S)-binding protein [Vicinamibacterales bacterium]